jgi:hypothetical protein
LAEDLNLFLEELCEKWDFCAGVKGADLLKDKKKPLTAKRFSDAVILAEGMDLKGAHQWERRLKRLFVQRYGREVSEKTWVL